MAKKKKQRHEMREIPQDNMNHVTLNNKLSGKIKCALGPIPYFDTVSDAGILPMLMVLEERIGTEMVLLWIDKTPFINELAQLQPFTLYLKMGLVQTSHGPLMFLLFHVANPDEPKTPFAMMDFHVNLFSPSIVSTLRDLDRQTHWHLILVDGEGAEVGLFEFSNDYGLGAALDQYVVACTGMSHGDFMAAKEEFTRTYSLEDLYNE
jgi:hypothetical protein